MPASEAEKFGRRMGKHEMDQGKVADEYDPSNFYVSSVDADKNKELVRGDSKSVWVPTFVWARMTAWVENDITHYRTMADYLRDAAIHRDHQLHVITNESDEAPSWRAMRKQVEIYRLTSEARVHKAAVANIKALAAEAWEDGNLDLYRETLSRAAELVADLRPPYSDDLKDYIGSQKKLRKIR